MSIRLENVFETVPGAVGLALIITNDYRNNSNFANLDATESDGTAMERAFKELGYATILQHNTTLVRLLSILKKADHTIYPPSCKRIAFVFAGHGREPAASETGTQLVTSEGRNISIGSIVKLLSPQSADSMLGDMVRMFFIDACRGDHNDEGRMIHRGGTVAAERRISVNAANYILCFSTLAGFRSYEMKENGGESRGLWLPLVAQKLTSCDKSISDVLIAVNEDLKSKFQDKSMYPSVMQPEATSCLNESVYLLREKPQITTCAEAPHHSSSVQKLATASLLTVSSPSTVCSSTGPPSVSLPPLSSLPRTYSTPVDSTVSSPLKLQSPKESTCKIKLAAIFSGSPQPLHQRPVQLPTCGMEAVRPPSLLTSTELVHRSSNQLSSGQYRDILNQFVQTSIISPSYTDSWNTQNGYDNQLQKSVFKVTVDCVLVSNNSVIRGDSKRYYEKKGVAQEMAARDAVEQMQQIGTILPVRCKVTQSLSLPTGDLTNPIVTSSIRTQTATPSSRRVYKQELNNYFQGVLRLTLPIYNTQCVDNGYKCHITHKELPTLIGCPSISGQECPAKKLAENSAAWRAWTMFENKGNS